MNLIVGKNYTNSYHTIFQVRKDYISRYIPRRGITISTNHLHPTALPTELAERIMEICFIDLVRGGFIREASFMLRVTKSFRKYMSEKYAGGIRNMTEILEFMCHVYGHFYSTSYSSRVRYIYAITVTEGHIASGAIITDLMSEVYRIAGLDHYRVIDLGPLLSDTAIVSGSEVAGHGVLKDCYFRAPVVFFKVYSDAGDQPDVLHYCFDMLRMMMGTEAGFYVVYENKLHELYFFIRFN